jgi:hypothetical protein
MVKFKTQSKGNCTKYKVFRTWGKAAEKMTISNNSCSVNSRLLERRSRCFETERTYVPVATDEQLAAKAARTELIQLNDINGNTTRITMENGGENPRKCETQTVTITTPITASESPLKPLSNEEKSRNGSTQNHS